MPGAASMPTVQTIGEDSPCSIRSHSNNSPRSLPRRSSVKIGPLPPIDHETSRSLFAWSVNGADSLAAHGFQFIASGGRADRDCFFAPFHGAARDGTKLRAARFIDRNQRAAATAQLRGTATLRRAGIVRRCVGRCSTRCQGQSSLSAWRGLEQSRPLDSPAECPVLNPLRLHLGRVHLAACHRDGKHSNRIGHELGRMQRSRAPARTDYAGQRWPVARMQVLADVVPGKDMDVTRHRERSRQRLRPIGFARRPIDGDPSRGQAFELLDQKCPPVRPGAIRLAILPDNKTKATRLDSAASKTFRAAVYGASNRQSRRWSGTSASPRITASRRKSDECKNRKGRSGMGGSQETLFTVQDTRPHSTVFAAANKRRLAANCPASPLCAFVSP